MGRYLLVGVVVSALALAATASAGGTLTLKSLDKRVKALTALVLLNERTQQNNPPTLKTMRVNAPMFSRGGGFYDGNVNCGGGTDWQVTGGGVSIARAGTGAATLASNPDLVNGWEGSVYAPGNSYAGGPPTVTVYAVCSQVEP